MSLQLLWSTFIHYPANLINGLALLFACPGGWLLHATRRREQQAQANLAVQREGRAIDQPLLALDSATQRINRFFYRFGFACLGLALAISWFSTRL